MPNLTVRGIPRSIYSILKREAKQHGRSLNAEILATFNDKAETARRRSCAIRDLEKLRAEIARKWPHQTDSVELIRELRDER